MFRLIILLFIVALVASVMGIAPLAAISDDVAWLLILAMIVLWLLGGSSRNRKVTPEDGTQTPLP